MIKLAIFLMVIAAMFGVGYYVGFDHGFEKAIEADKPDPTPVETGQTTLVGEYICLPHKNSDEPHTLECALGIKSDIGGNYALDMSGLLNTDAQTKIPTGSRIQVRGHVVPIEAISSDQWAKYADMKGIMRVEEFSQI